MQYTNGAINLNLLNREFAPMDKFDVDKHIVCFIMAYQYSMKKGIGLFGKRAEKASLKELKHTHDKDTYTLMDPNKLTKEQKRKALSILFFLTEKRDDRIKGRQVADGRLQRTFNGYKKSDGASPTCSTNGVIITTAIDGHEGRVVAIMDILGA